MYYNARFAGRKKDAIGVSRWISTTIKADNEEAASLALYDRF